ncbi:MAG TPA: class I SAM-dependent methyltransferase [Vicinamibacterales bacterium]|nr:class I SAM-dependent methyltransferase [Vicinamibacterales bacterium]
MAAAIYTREFVRELFDEMSGTYGIVNVVSSFGFCLRWRRQCVDGARLASRGKVCDLMSGAGELWPLVVRDLGGVGHITAVDLSPSMNARGATAATALPIRVDVLTGDALASPLLDASVDVVMSSFGLKTFNRCQLRALAIEVARILKPGGRVSFVEISVPPSTWLRVVYMFYIARVIPLIGAAFLGNPDNYRMLGIYTSAFANCEYFRRCCEDAGLSVRSRALFFGCATGVVGQRPEEAA